MKILARFMILFLIFFVGMFMPVASAQLSSFGYSRSVSYVDQQKMIESKMYLTRTQKTEIVRNPGDLKYMVERMMQNVKRSLENLRYGQGDRRLIREETKRKLEAVKEQTRILKQRQEMFLANQKDRQREMKDRMETLARQRKDMMQLGSR